MTDRSPQVVNSAKAPAGGKKKASTLSTAEGTSQYNRLPDVARTQIPLIIANAEFPSMTILTRQHKTIKCLCCYQNLVSKEQLQPLSWRSVDFTSEAPRFGSSGNTPYNVDLTNSSILSHISHKAPHRRYIYPYTCVAEHCSMPHLLFAARKPWERLMKGDHARTWECILCEEGDISFTEVEDINILIQTSHEDELRS